MRKKGAPWIAVPLILLNTVNYNYMIKVAYVFSVYGTYLCDPYVIRS